MKIRSDFCITTSPAANAERIDAAVRTARHWCVDFIPRTAATLATLRRAYPAVLVFGPEQVRLADPLADVRYSAGIAYRRIAALRRGGRDPLCTVAGLEPGVTVLDATLGLGRDALVAASIIGPTGRVVALEASVPLAAFTSAGIAECPLPPPGVRADIAVHHAEAVAWLRDHDRRFAVALVDPMFDRPRRAHPTFDLVRRHGCHEPLTNRLLDAVLDRADRAVVRVGHPSSWERLNRTPIRTVRSGRTFWAIFAGNPTQPSPARLRAAG